MKQHYAFSDLHGHYNLWEQIKNFADKTDKLIFLGDAIDRGPDSIKLMLELLSDDRVTYLCGNHELMMMNAFKTEQDPDYIFDYYNAFALWLGNGGNMTMNELKERYNDDFDLKIKLKNKIEELYHCHHYEYINANNQKILLSHAGGDYKNFINPEKLNIWDREHLYHEWDGPNEEIYIVHGHTPTQHLLESDNPEMYKYCNGHKIDIDMGAFISKKTCLLNLDTLEPIYFEEKGE